MGIDSLAISAAFRPLVEDTDAAFLLARWSAVSYEMEDGPGHCCLSSFEVEKPWKEVGMGGRGRLWWKQYGDEECVMD